MIHAGPPPAPDRAGPAIAGFTLLELLVVLGLLALGLALVAPSLGQARAGLAVRSTAYELAASLRAARAAARATNVAHALTIDLARRQYWADGVIGPRPLPRGLAVEATLPDSERLSGAAGRVRFFPDGSASGARLVVQDARSSAVIEVHWLNGDVRLQVR
jgi:general secretion pathway protein H